MSSNWKIWRDNPRFLALQSSHNFIVSSFLRCTGKQVTKNPSNSISTFQFVKRKGYAHDLNTPHQTVEHSVWISQQMADLKKTKNLKAWWWHQTGNSPSINLNPPLSSLCSALKIPFPKFISLFIKCLKLQTEWHARLFKGQQYGRTFRYCCFT